MRELAENIEKILPQVRDWRREIHQFPELGFQECKTQRLILDVLEGTGLKLLTHPDSTAVVAVLEGDTPGPVTGFRADMDALAVEEMADVPYKSQHAGVMHACGHDFHVAILLGAARILSARKEEVAGTLLFIFQPAEEAPPGGARQILELGLLDDFTIDRMLALHVASDLTTGEIMVTPGFSSANTDGAEIILQGKSCHGATPHKGVDAVLMAGHILVALQSIVSRNVDPLEAAVVSVGTVEAGEIVNSIAEKAVIKATVRSLSSETRDLLCRRIQEVARGICQALGGDCTVEYHRGYPAIYNDEEITTHIQEVGRKVLGPDKVHVTKQTNMGGDDYAYFLQKSAGAIFLLGGASEERTNYPHHNSRFQINEDCLGYGLQMACHLLLSRDWRRG